MCVSFATPVGGRKVARRRVGAACEQPVVADRSRVAATHRRTTSLFGESEVPLISRKAARSRVEVDIIDAELDMSWLADLGRALSGTCIHCILILT